MEKIINHKSIEQILKNTDVDCDSFKTLTELLFFYCIKIDINDEKIGFDVVENNIKNLKLMEKVSLYVFSNFSKCVENKFDNSLIRMAMHLSALAFEKLGKYIEHISTDELDYQSIIHKQLKYYLRSSIAYQLASNQPNSIYIAKKLSMLIEKLKSSDIVNSELIELYRFCSCILNRTFLNSDCSLKTQELINIVTNMSIFLNSGNVKYINQAIEDLQTVANNMLLSYKTQEFWILKYMLLCINNFKSHCVWTTLKDKFSDDYIRQLVKSRPAVIELWPNQLKIINDQNSFLNNNSIKRTVINFPTSGGKSLIAEMAIIKELEKDNTKKCIYIVPTNALVYEISKKFKERFRRIGYRVTNSMSGFERQSPIEDYRDTNVIITTQEKLDTIIRNDKENSLLSEVSLIIFDEFHKIAEKERGWVIEGCIWYLVNNPHYKDIKLVILSAIMDNGESILNWIDNDTKCSDYITDDWTPTIKVRGTVNYEYAQNDRGRWVDIPINNEWYKPGCKAYLAESKINYLVRNNDKSFHNISKVKLFSFPRYHNDDNTLCNNDLNIKIDNLIMGVAEKLKNTGGNLIFFNTKNDCEEFINNYEPYFKEKFVLSDEVKKLISYVKKRLGEGHLLIRGLEKGVVYHHGSLPLDIREAVEDFFAKGYIKTMICTTTLAEGVNFPIQNFIYTGLKYRGQRTVNIGDFKNIAGRAGRAYQSTYGQVLFIAFNQQSFDERYLDYDIYKNEVKSSIVDDSELFEFNNNIDQLDNDSKIEFIKKITSNNFIKSLLIFFNDITDSEENLETIINSTLFAKQLEKVKLNELTSFSKKIYRFFHSRTRFEREKVQHSGLSFFSYDLVSNFADSIYSNLSNSNFNFNSLSEILSPDVFNQIISLKESLSFRVRRSTPRSRFVQIDNYNLFIDWIESNANVLDISNKYFKDVEEKYRMSRVTEYIKDMFEFKLPWIFGTICSIICDKLYIESRHENLIQYFNNLPMYIKYGINSSLEMNLANLGFNSRDTIKDIAHYIIQNFTNNDLNDLETIVKDIDPLILKNSVENITDYEVRKLISVTNNLKEVTNQAKELGGISTHIASTRYNLCTLTNRDIIINEVVKNKHNIILEHERNNFYDEYAVAVYYDKNKIGYIPRDVNEEISYYLDLNYSCQVEVEKLNVVDINKYIEIAIKIAFE